MKSYKGFTLIEIVVILAVIAILASMAVPMALRLFQVTATTGTNDEMQTVKNALLGDPTKIANGVRTDFGYLGDIGCLPTAAFPSAPALDRLNTQGTLPAWSFNATQQIGAGWNGPYITGAPSDYENDQWGNAYTYTIAGACPLTATFKSPGQDGVAGNADDIDYSIVATETTSTVSGYVKDPNGNPSSSSTATINYPVNGTLTTASDAADATGFYTISGIPFGKRSLNVTPKLVVTSANALTSGDTTFCDMTSFPSSQTFCTYVEFRLVNFTGVAVTGITSLTANFGGGGFYYRINWGVTNVFNSNSTGVGTGTARSITSSSVGAATALSPIVFNIDNSQEQLPDIRVGTSGQVGTVIIVQIINFRTLGTGDRNGTPVPMGGIAFTITFTDGSTVYFTPSTTP